jgi:hypothetical protein
MQAAVRLIFANYCKVSFDHRLHLVMPRKLNTQLLLFSVFGPRLLESMLRFLYSSAWKLSIGHFGHIQGKMHVGMFKLYPTSFCCHSSWHIENLQEISCCF